MAQTTAPSEESFPASIQRAIGIKAGKEDVLGPLTDVFENVRKNGPNLDKTGYLAVDKLVTVLSLEANVDSYEDSVVKELKISEGDGKFRPGQESKLGSYVDLFKLSTKIYELAKPLHDKDPQKAALYARAALLLSAMTYFEARTGPSRILVDDKQFASVAGLDEAQLLDVKAVIKKFVSRTEEYFKDRHLVLVCEETLVANKDPGKVSLADLAMGLSAFDAAWTESKFERNDRFEMVWLAWEYLNLANIKKDQSAIDRIEALIKSWQTSRPDEMTQKWLKEALGVRGKMPVSHISHLPE
jgi:hypothetical protein